VAARSLRARGLVDGLAAPGWFSSRSSRLIWRRDREFGEVDLSGSQGLCLWTDALANKGDHSASSCVGLGQAAHRVAKKKKSSIWRGLKRHRGGSPTPVPWPAAKWLPKPPSSSSYNKGDGQSWADDRKPGKGEMVAATNVFRRCAVEESHARRRRKRASRSNRTPSGCRKPISGFRLRRSRLESISSLPELICILHVALACDAGSSKVSAAGATSRPGLEVGAAGGLCLYQISGGPEVTSAAG